MGAAEIAIAGIVIACVAYVAWVSRARQTYTASTVFDAPVSEVWRLHDIRPERPIWLPSMASCVWVDEAARDMLVTYTTGAEMRNRVLAEEPGRYVESEARMRARSDAPFGDLLRSEIWMDPTPSGGARVRSRIDVVREPGGTLGARLTYPWVVYFSWSIMRRRLAEEGFGPPRPKSRAVIVQLALVAATLGSFAWLIGLWASLGLLVMLIVHEYGHVWAMRRNGHEAARFYLIPFFGGVAIGSRLFRSEAEAVQIFLMGPLFGLMPSLVALLLAWMTDDPFWAALAGFLAIVNGFNLAPMPPLDGGRVTQSLLRGLGDKAWFAASGLLILVGAMVAVYFRLGGLLAVSALGALAWSAAPKPRPETRPLSISGAALSAAAYGALILAHVILIGLSFDLDTTGALDAGPAFTQEASPAADEPRDDAEEGPARI
jgi:Zn-dependent protease